MRLNARLSLTAVLLLVAILCGICAATASAQPLPPVPVAPVTHIFPYANLGADTEQWLQSTLKIVNPTDDWVEFTPPASGLGSNLLIAPYATYDYIFWPKPGGSVAGVSLPASLRAYVEVRGADGSAILVLPLQTFDSTTHVQAVSITDIQRADAFVATFGTAALSLQWFRDSTPIGNAVDVSVSAGSAAIVSGPLTANRYVVTYKTISGNGTNSRAPFYTFAFQRGVGGTHDFQGVIYAAPLAD